MSDHGPILSLDPSSTCTGYAVFGRGDGAWTLSEAGLLKPTKAGASLIYRVQWLVEDIRGILDYLAPRTVLVEAPGGKQYTRDPGKTSSLPAWAFAAGAAFGACHLWALENNSITDCIGVPITWTRGTTKDTRADAVHAQWPRFQWPKRKGYDAEDAAALAWWWLNQRRP